MGINGTGARDLGAVVFGFERLVLLAVDEHDGELELAARTSHDMVGCPGCGAIAAAHGRRAARVRDLPVGGRPTTLVWVKRLWRCRHEQCGVRTWPEQSREILARASLEHARHAARLSCRAHGESVAVVTWDLRGRWGTVMRAVVEPGFDALGQVQQHTYGHRGCAGNPFYGIRRVLRRGHDHHCELSWTRLLRGLGLGDLNGEVAAAWIAVQDLRLLYRHRDPQRAAAASHPRLQFCADSGVPEPHRLARAMDSWREELLTRFHVSAVPNGPTEAINLLIKKIKRVGHGFRNFVNYRMRLLLHCGLSWDAPATTMLRGRLHAS